MGDRRTRLHRSRTARSRAGGGREGNIVAARRAILSAADALFYEDGVAATGLQAVAAAADVTRRTLYYHFATKEALVAEYLRRRDVSGRALVENAAGIEAVFDALGT
ncbi:hypothetical protein WPS_27160 [Vulcanimicrobium alpinum]|uniref:HTH tetR-type domain-containing protein n=1 Tax=Vulcanimicrobium alpinum TaxID=3016050 RepID=A0AAN2CAA0_UNVUL|nr:helix-turn-helix domain-containing protein [Vulcanimicrobium alpinum]BDE07440.1 hypothetical protein WPS_27160 [Vulcanimicrobium alpinum]